MTTDTPLFTLCTLPVSVTFGVVSGVEVIVVTSATFAFLLGLPMRAVGVPRVFLSSDVVAAVATDTPLCRLRTLPVSVTVGVVSGVEVIVVARVLFVDVAVTPTICNETGWLLHLSAVMAWLLRSYDGYYAFL